MKSELFQVIPAQKESLYLFAVVAFIAGFSERWVNVIFGALSACSARFEEPNPNPNPNPPTDEGSPRV